MTKFEGSTFLTEYLKSREEILALTKFKKKYTKFDELRNNFNTSFKIKNNKKLFQNEILTNELFSFILNEIINRSYDEQIKEIIDIFLKKFEVTKKIFSSYNLGLKQTSNSYDDLQNYINFSIICLKIFQDTKNLKYLNTSLKINDIICANIRISQKVNLPNLIEFIINNEIKFVTKLFSENDV